MKALLTLTLLILMTAITLQAVPRDMCIVEIATGTGCPYCPGSAMAADELVQNRSRVAPIEYHGYNANDPYNTPAAAARISYYGITGFPTAKFDGGAGYVGGSYDESLYTPYLGRVNSRMNVPSNYTISAVGTHTGEVYNVTVTITRMETDTHTGLKLHGVLTESGISYNWQNQSHLEFVQRLMAPDQNGTDISFTSGETQTVNLTFTTLPAWNDSEFDFVFFLQNNSTKEILQGCKYNVPALENAAPITLPAIDFGTIENEGVYTSNFTLHNWWSHDMTGDMSVDDNNFFVSPYARSPYTVPFLSDGEFMVFFAPTQTGIYNANLTITTNVPAYPTITIPVTANVVAITANDDDNSPTAVNALLSAYPNPFSTTANIRYIVKSPSRVDISIYNLKGERVVSLVQTSMNRGNHSAVWNGLDSNGNTAPAGMYFSRMSVNGKVVSSNKLVKIR